MRPQGDTYGWDCPPCLMGPRQHPVPCLGREGARHDLMCLHAVDATHTHLLRHCTERSEARPVARQRFVPCRRGVWRGNWEARHRPHRGSTSAVASTCPGSGFRWCARKAVNAAGRWEREASPLGADPGIFLPGPSQTASSPPALTVRQ